MGVTFDISKVPESVYNVVKDLVGSAIGVSADVTQPAVETFEFNKASDVKSKLLDEVKTALGDLPGLFVQVEEQPGKKSSFTLTRHARTVGVKFDAVIYTFDVTRTVGTMQVFDGPGSAISGVGHWLQKVTVNGSVESNRVGGEIKHSTAEDTTGEEKGGRALIIDTGPFKGRGWFNWDGPSKRDELTILADGTISISKGKHIEEG